MSATGSGTPGEPGSARGQPQRLPGSMMVRLRLALAVFVLLMAAATALVAVGLSEQASATRSVVQRLQPLEVTTSQIRADFADTQAALRAYVETRTPRFLGFYRSARVSLAHDLAAAAALATGASVTDLEIQRRSVRTWFGYADRMLAASPGSPAVTRLTNRAYPVSRVFYEANDRMRARLRAQSRLQVSQGEARLDRSVVLGGLLAGLAVLVAVAVEVGTVRSVAVPLRGLTVVLQRLTSGDYGARASVAGPAETREAAASLNELADEASRLRVQEADRGRLTAVARAAGLRIRENLRAEDVLNEARAVIEQELGGDTAYLHLVEDGRVGPPLGHERDWVLPLSFLDNLGPDFIEMMRGLYPRHGALVVQDFQGPDGALIPPEFRQPMIDAGLVSQVLAPFGVGPEMLGFIVLSRRTRGRPWTPAEVDAVQSIATDLGRGLQHARAYEAENTLVTELREIDRMKSDFLATVSHELRTPLTSIAGFVELLRDRDAGPLSETQAEMLDTIQRNTARLRHLIEDVLTLSKIESRAFKTAMQPVNLAEVAAAVVAALRPQADARKLSLTLTGPGSLVVSGDPGQLDRMLINLLSNAVKFTPAGGRVEVSVAGEAGMAVVTVSDTGIGIPDRDQKELFTRFFRGSNATELSIPGTGLGLTIVQAIIANHGGDLSVHSRQGEGTTVVARIPLLTARGVATVPTPPASRDGPPPGGDLTHRS
ncbi:MAG: ATP-binding protein [Gemmatimonadota bacterium]